MKEVWRDIPNYEDMYQVSNLGDIRSLDRWVGNRFFKGRVLVGRVAKNGYKYVGLNKDRKAKTVKNHVMTARMFIGERPKGLVINHKDENKLNNSVENLEYITVLENNMYGTHMSRIAEKNSKAIIGTHIKTGKKIYFKSLTDAGKIGFNVPTISMCCNHIRNAHKGYQWEFA